MKLTDCTEYSIKKLVAMGERTPSATDGVAMPAASGAET